MVLNNIAFYTGGVSHTVDSVRIFPDLLNWEHYSRLCLRGSQSAGGEMASYVFTLCFPCMTLPKRLVYLSGLKKEVGGERVFPI